jgi:SAM-dependent methyltransferase
MSRNCPVCHSGSADAELFLDENIDYSRITTLSFASRKTPEFMCYRLVRCTVCDLVYADAPPDNHFLGSAYHEAGYDSAAEAEDAANSYLEAITPIIARLNSKNTGLEIGAGSGAFLSRLLALGFKEVKGVEPSLDAIEAASAVVKPLIVRGMFEVSDFKPNHFDLVCCFMTLEHVHDPREIMESVLKLLRPGGVFITVTHDYRSWINRLLGKRSPIIDLEHMQIFSKGSIQMLFKNTGFEHINIRNFKNKYSITYWIKLLPIPLVLKDKLLFTIKLLGLSKIKLSINVGNTITAGFRPK